MALAELVVRTGLLCSEQLAPARLSVLIFHRVLASRDPLFPSEMDAPRFDRLMSLVARSFNVLRLGEALAAHAAGQLPSRALAITFDDGYADNAEIAVPILERHGLRATFFVATGFLDGGRMFNDTIIECLRATRSATLDLAEWGQGKVSLSTREERRRSIDALLGEFKYMTPSEREPALRRLLDLAGHPSLPNDLMMRSSQVQQLQRAGMEIGAHTVSHPILRTLPDSEAESEMAAGRRRLQDLTGAAVDLFAYPNGRPGRDYDERHVAMAKKLGFRAAVSTVSGVVDARSDRFELPRFTPWTSKPVRWGFQIVRRRLDGSVSGAAKSVVGNA